MVFCSFSIANDASKLNFVIWKSWYCDYWLSYTVSLPTKWSCCSPGMATFEWPPLSWQFSHWASEELWALLSLADLCLFTVRLREHGGDNVKLLGLGQKRQGPSTSSRHAGRQPCAALRSSVTSIERVQMQTFNPSPQWVKEEDLEFEPAWTKEWNLAPKSKQTKVWSHAMKKPGMWWAHPPQVPGTWVKDTRWFWPLAPGSCSRTFKSSQLRSDILGQGHPPLSSDPCSC